MLKFIDIKVHDNSDPSGKPSQTSLSFNDNSDRLRIVGVLPHGSEIYFNKNSAQMLIDFLQRTIINK